MTAGNGPPQRRGAGVLRAYGGPMSRPSSLVDWDLAGRTARRLVKAGPDTSREEASAVVAELHRAAATAVAHVEQLTGLHPVPGGPVPTVAVVDRPGWVEANTAGMSALLAGLPVAGYDGTLAERAADGAGSPGAVRAKTGTLQGVNDLAGTVLTADGRLLAFAVLADGAAGSIDATEAALDRVAAALAGCGCR